MARPKKIGLDYFPLDTLPNEKIELLQATHGLEGFAVFIKLLQRIYKKGCYIQWDEKEKLIFTSKNQIKNQKLNEIIDCCCKWNLFDKEMFEDKGVLTSAGIQKRYFEVSKRRQNDDINEEFILVNATKTDVNVTKTKVNATKTLVNAEFSTQSKEKKSKKRKNTKKEKAEAPLLESFENILWKNYPRKQGKLKARQAFLKKIIPRLTREPDLIDKILSHIISQTHSPDWKKDNGSYIPHFATYINGERWNDQPTQKPDWRNA